MTKIKKLIKYDNYLVYNSVHNFNEYSVLIFNEISSIDSKFDTINKFYKDLLNYIMSKVKMKIKSKKK